jgi:hypothetical protein
MLSLKLRGLVQMENVCFDGFSTSPHLQEHSAAVGGIPDSVKLAAIFDDFNALYFSI